MEATRDWPMEEAGPETQERKRQRLEAAAVAWAVGGRPLPGHGGHYSVEVLGQEQRGESQESYSFLGSGQPVAAVAPASARSLGLTEPRADEQGQRGSEGARPLDPRP